MIATAPLSPLIERLTTELGISRAEFASALDASERSVARWTAGNTFPQHESRARLETMTALADRLRESFTEEDAAIDWLHAPSGYFGGLAPIDALLRGRFDRVEAALEALDAGIFV
ncbi:MAG: DUF2384 domain-containing protein [Thermomicrobiales bacterium]|nr:DUF2384 domain-containing protein [Thermomicrobiales bacterium]MCO5220715.1 MbcA/ParS/Xre antitoxin family protein [Thermomicrobiales bacterium]